MIFVTRTDRHACRQNSTDSLSRQQLKTVLQEIMYRAAKFVGHSRRRVLDFGFGVAVHVHIFMGLQDRLLRAQES